MRSWKLRRKRGVMLLLAMGLVGILWFLAVGFANHSTQHLRLAQTALASERALLAAEAGLTATLNRLAKNSDYRPSAKFIEMSNTAESYKVEIFQQHSAPVKIPDDSLYIESTGRDRTGALRRAVAVVKVTKGGGGAFDFSVFAQTIDMAGGCSIDSFDSTVGPWQRGEAANVATNSVKPGSIELSGGSYIKGQIQVGPGGATGEARPSRPTKRTENVVWKDWSCWSLEESNLDQPLEFPPVQSPSPGKEDIKVKWNGADVEPGAYDTLTANGGGEVRLTSGTYVFKSIKLTGGAKLSFKGDSPAIIYVTEDLDMSNGTVYNTTQKPKNLIFMMDKGGQAKLRGGAQAYMVVYGPEADIDLAGGTDLYGALVGRDVKLRGGAHIHYDIDLARNPPPIEGPGGSGAGGIKLISWQRF